jgi:hypothetical protein
MSEALIRFPNGEEACLYDGVWTCPVRDLETVLNLHTRMLPPRHRPSPTADLAREVAAEVGAVVIRADEEIDDAPEDAEFGPLVSS